MALFAIPGTAKGCNARGYSHAKALFHEGLIGWSRHGLILALMTIPSQTLVMFQEAQNDVLGHCWLRKSWKSRQIADKSLWINLIKRGLCLTSRIGV